jgi:hypothetical protein
VNSPILKAVEWSGANDFDEEFSWHLLHGYVWSNPSFFLMARPVPKHSIHQAGELVSFDRKISDVWYVWLAAGVNPFQKFLKVAPFKLPYVAWHRDTEEVDRFKIWSWEHFDKVSKKLRRYKHGKKTQKVTA